MSLLRWRPKVAVMKCTLAADQLLSNALPGILTQALWPFILQLLSISLTWRGNVIFFKKVTNTNFLCQTKPRQLKQQKSSTWVKGTETFAAKLSSKTSPKNCCEQQGSCINPLHYQQILSNGPNLSRVGLPNMLPCKLTLWTTDATASVIWSGALGLLMALQGKLLLFRLWEAGLDWCGFSPSLSHWDSDSFWAA